MKYLITGGFGFLGTNISKRILETGHELFVIDNFSRVGSTENLNYLEKISKFYYKNIDIRDYSLILNTVGNVKPDIIFHLAGQVAMTTSILNPKLDFEVNTLGTLNILEAVRNASPYSGIIYSSTNKVYGDLSNYVYQTVGDRYLMPDFPNGLNENIPLNFHSPYGCSKGAADQYVLDYSRIYNLNTIVFRHSSMYGGHQYSTIDQGWIGWFCQQALLQKGGLSEFFTISGSGKQVRDILHANDMVDVYINSSNHINQMTGNAYNVGGGIKNSLSILELIGHLENLLDIKIAYKNLKPRESDQLFFVANLEKLQSKINWSPQIDIYEGIKMMIEWISSLKKN